MPADTPGCAGRGKEDDGIAHHLDVVLERFELLIRQLWVGRVELEPGTNITGMITTKRSGLLTFEGS